MDATPQNSAFPTVSKPPFYKNKIVIILIVILLQTAYTLVLFKFFQTKPQSEPFLSAEKMISEDELPIGLSLLHNPIINQWRGAVEGILTAKDNKTITLENTKIHKDAKITIPLNAPQSEEKKPMTAFYNVKLAKYGKSSPEVDLKDIPLGTYLRGDFFVIPWPNDKNKIVGSSFTIVDK